MSNADDITQRLQELTTFIEEAHKQLKEGEVVNLSLLDDEVGELCDQTLQLKPQEAVKVQPVMADMINKLEKLGVALKDYQEAHKMSLSNKN